MNGVGARPNLSDALRSRRHPPDTVVDQLRAVSRDQQGAGSLRYWESLRLRHSLSGSSTWVPLPSAVSATSHATMSRSISRMDGRLGNGGFDISIGRLAWRWRRGLSIYSGDRRIGSFSEMHCFDC